MNWNTIAKSLGIQYVGRIIGLLVSLASVSLLTRYLGVGHFGEYTAAQAIANLVITFSDFGFFWSTVQNFLHPEGRLESVKEILGIRVIVTILLIMLSIVAVQFGNFTPIVKQGYLILSIFIFASAVNNILIALYQAEYNMLWPTLVEFGSRVVNLAVILLGIYLHLPVLWFIVGVSIASFTNLAVNWIGLYRQKRPLYPRLIGIPWKKYYNSVALVGLMSLFSALFYKIDIVILSWFKSSVDVGIYGAAQKIVELTMVAQGLFLASLFPLLVNRFQNDRPQFFDAMRKAVIISAAIGFPTGIFGLFLDRQVVGLIGGKQFLSESTISYHGYAITTPVALAILLVFVMISYLSSPYTTGVLASGEVLQLVKVNFLATVLNIGLNLWLIPRYSYLAASFTTLLTEILVLAFNGLYFCLRYSFTPPWRDIGKVILATIPGSIFLLATSSVTVIIRAPLVMVLYGFCLLWLLPDYRASLPFVGISKAKTT